MINDARTEFLDLTATSGTDQTDVLVGNVIDTNQLDPGTGEPIHLVIVCDIAASGGTSIRFKLASDSTANLATSPTLHYDTGPILVGTFVAGYVAAIAVLPWAPAYERYLGILMTTVGAVTAAKTSAFLTHDPSRFRLWAGVTGATR